MLHRRPVRAGGIGVLSCWPRWLVLRALGLIFFSAFYSLWFQIHGLVGEQGILPAGDYLRAVSAALAAPSRYGIQVV
jgi:hypothetical protein